MTDRPTALGAYVFAGGFSIGVESAGHEVLAHYEGKGAYGASSARLNWPDRPIHHPPAEWPVAEHRGRVGFVYANPPCAIFSSMGIATTRGEDAWRDDPRTECWYDCFSLLEGLRPGALAVESVTQAYTTGRELIDELTKRALLLGYSVTHLLLDAKWFGVPQSRKRFFFVAHRAPRLVGYLPNWAPPPTVGEALATAAADPGPSVPAPDRLLHLALNTTPGHRLCRTFDQLYPDPELNAQGKVRGRPSFQDRRLDPNETMGAFAGDKCWHPVEPRKVGINEAKALCGYPLDFRLDGPLGGQPSLLARAVMPPVGAWLGRAVASTLARPAVEDRTGLRVTLVDVREPEREPVDLTSEYLTPEGRVRLRTGETALEPLTPPWEKSDDREPSHDAQDPRSPEPTPSSVRSAEGPAGPEKGQRLGVVRRNDRPASPRRRSGNPGGERRPVVETVADDAGPRPGEGSGRCLQRWWLTGKYSPEELVARVHANWDGRTTRVSDVYYNYQKLLDAGVPDVPPWPKRRAASAPKRTSTLPKQAFANVESVVVDPITWILEREKIRKLKEAGTPKPWTTDPVLQRFRFCNVRREDDAVSRWLFQNWYPVTGPTVYAAVLARSLNRVSSLDRALKTGLAVTWDRGNWNELPKPLFNGSAYSLRGTMNAWGASGIGTGRSAIGDLLAFVYRSSVKPAGSIQSTYDRLRSIKGIGPFLASQIAMDLGTALGGNLPDENEFSPEGPGSNKGLALLQNNSSDDFYQIIAKLCKDWSTRTGLTLRVRDVEQVLCEWHKYNVFLKRLYSID